MLQVLSLMGQWVLCASRWHETNLAERHMLMQELQL
jgi:uncharacterized protein (DUF2237 family)